MTLAEKIQEMIEQEATVLWPDVKLPPFDVVAPPQPEFGDLSSALPLTLAKILQQNPMVLAKALKNNLDKQNIENIKEITVTEPGYVNFIIDYKTLSNHLIKKILQNDVYEPKTEKGKVVVEHTSVNPNKAAHIGHLRNACLGDALARILEANGYTVEIENYIDDLGLQVADSVVAFEYFKKDLPKDFFKLSEKEIAEKFWEIYPKIQKIYENKPKVKEQRDVVLHEMEEFKNPIAKEIVKKIVKAHEKTFKQFNINYDLLVYESKIIKNKLWESLFEELKKEKLIHQATSGDNKNAWVVKFGQTDREDKILVRSNGIPTYTAKDLAYQLWKFNKTAKIATGKNKFERADQVINVIDNRQSYPQAVIKHVLSELGHKKEAENSQHLSYGVVKLSEAAYKSLKKSTSTDSSKKTYTMSGREGVGVMVDDLLSLAIEKLYVEGDEAKQKQSPVFASAAIRYYMLKNRPKKDIIFDFDEALRSDGNTGIYLQYAYARCCNILNKVPEWQYQGEAINAPKDISKESQELIKLIETFPYKLDLSAKELDPSLLADYAVELCNAFAKFYETNPVLQADRDKKVFRLCLISAFKKVLAKLLELLLGTSKPLEKI